MNTPRGLYVAHSKMVALPAARPPIHRIFWFYEQLAKGAYPNAKRLAAHFEVSYKTAWRDIEFVRYRLSAIVVYVTSRNGYAFAADHCCPLCRRGATTRILNKERNNEGKEHYEE